MTTIKLRRDTAANWTTVNPILAQGEVGIELDTGKTKIGDGSTAWNSLDYSLGSTALQSGDNVSDLENDANYLSGSSVVTPLIYKATGISTTVTGSIDSNGYLEGTTSSAEAEFVPETTVASLIIFNDVFNFTSHSAWTNDAMLDVVFSEPFTVGNTTNDRLRLYVTRFGTVYFIIGSQDNIYTGSLIGNSGTYDSRINLVLSFTDSGDNWTIGTGVTNFSGSTWQYGNSSGTCSFYRTGSNTATIPKTAKIKKFVLYNSTQSRVDTINTSIQIGANVYTINTDSAGLKLSYNTDNLTVNNNNQLDLSGTSKVIDGQWVSNTIQLANAETLPDSSNIVYDLISLGCLPADATTYQYEIYLDCILYGSATSGEVSNLQVSAGVFSSRMCYVISRGAALRSSNSATLPVSTLAKLNIVGVAGNKGTFSLWFKGYRRIGTNA